MNMLLLGSIYDIEILDDTTALREHSELWEIWIFNLTV